MTKQEFEAMIEKEITAETYAVYEAMYLAAPETVDKKTFVSMLNIDAIPESPEAIERRERAEAWKQEQLAKIDDLKKELDTARRYKAEEESAFYFWKDMDAEYAKTRKAAVKYWKGCAKLIKNQIAEIRFLIEA